MVVTLLWYSSRERYLFYLRWMGMLWKTWRVTNSFMLVMHAMAGSSGFQGCLSVPPSHSCEGQSHSRSLWTKDEEIRLRGSEVKHTAGTSDDILYPKGWLHCDIMMISGHYSTPSLENRSAECDRRYWFADTAPGHPLWKNSVSVFCSDGLNVYVKHVVEYVASCSIYI